MTLLVALGALLLLLQQPGTTDPRAVVREATRAVEGDSVAAVEARWSARLQRDPSDRWAILGLTTLARLTYDYLAAERGYARLDSPAGAEDRFAVYAVLGRGQALAVQARRDAAMAELTRAAALARQTGDVVAEVEALLELAGLASGATEDSLRARAAALVPPGELRLQARLKCGWAGPPGRAGAQQELAAQQEGIALARRSGEQRTYAACMLGTAKAHYRLGEYDAALLASSEAAALQRRLHDRAGLAATLYWRGYLLSTLGEYGLARQALAEAVQAGRASGAAGPHAAALLFLTTTTLRFGDLPSALRLADQADSLLTAQANQRLLTTLRTVQGDLARAAGDTAGARARYRDALSLGGAAGGYPSLAPRRALASLARQAGDWETAERELLAARAAAAQHRLEEWADRLEYDLAALALARGDLAGAERGFRAFLARLGPEARGRGYAARVRLAEIHAQRGEIAEAEAALSAATDALDEWRATLDDRELRLLVFQRRDDDVDPDLGRATILARLASSGRLDAAFALAERRRARELHDRLTRFTAARLEPASASRPAEDAWRAHGPAALAELVAALPDDSTALLAYVTGWGGEPTTLFVLTRRGGVAHVLAEIDSLAADLQRFTALVQDGTAAPGLARRLGAELLHRAVADLPPGIVRLVVVPDGGLYHLPFDALVLEDGRLVIERFAVSLAPSAAIAAALWRRPRVLRPATLLALGDPRFDHQLEGLDAAGQAYRAAFAEAGGLPRLAASGREARAVARFAPAAEVRLGPEASEAYLKRTALERFRVLHFATHAVVDEQVMTRTALVLAPGEGEDGFLDPAELAGLRLDADLVVLSACRTAGGVVVGGEGVQGLTAPLLQAGARAVLATGWPIGDQSTARVVDSFYRGLARGLPAGEALRMAKLEAWRRGAPPSEWAAFTLVGDPLVTLPLRMPLRRWPWWLAGALLVLAAAYGSWRRNSWKPERRWEPSASRASTHQR